MSSSFNRFSNVIFLPFGSPLFHFEPIDIDSIDEELAKSWFLELSSVKLTDKKVTRFIGMYKAMNEAFPSKEEIEKEFCCVNCMCELGFLESVIVNMKKHYLFTQGRLPSCRETENIFEYETLNKRYPTYKELKEYIQQKVLFNRDPVEYFNNDKVDRPADTSKSFIIHPDEDVHETCAICFDEINTNSYYKLPCGHLFHSKKENCLGEASIEEWFKKNNFCPNCKQKL